MERLLNTKDLEQIFSFGRKKILYMCQNNVIPVTKIGKNYVISPTALERWLSENEGKEIKL